MISNSLNLIQNNGIKNLRKKRNLKYIASALNYMYGVLQVDQLKYL